MRKPYFHLSFVIFRFSSKDVVRASGRRIIPRRTAGRLTVIRRVALCGVTVCRVARRLTVILRVAICRAASRIVPRSVAGHLTVMRRPHMPHRPPQRRRTPHCHAPAAICRVAPSRTAGHLTVMRRVAICRVAMCRAVRAPSRGISLPDFSPSPSGARTRSRTTRRADLSCPAPPSN